MRISPKSHRGSSGKINRNPRPVVDEAGITAAGPARAAELRQLVRVLARQAAREWLAVAADERRELAPYVGRDE
jgi:hypothetical protein